MNSCDVPGMGGLEIECKVLCTLDADRQEGVEHGFVVADRPAELTCILIAQSLGCYIREHGAKWVAYGEDGGLACYTIRSNASRRCAEFRISRNGALVDVSKVDADGREWMYRWYHFNQDKFDMVADWVCGVTT